MVLVSVQSVEDNEGYDFKNDFAESIIINPNSSIQLINCQFERRADFVVLNGGNEFEVQVGGESQPLDRIEIKANTYSAQALCDEIQQKLNNKYSPLGHSFEVDYDFKDKRFEISDNYKDKDISLTSVLSWNNTNPAYVESADIVPVSDNGEIDFGGITKSKANYIGTDTRLETKNVPSYESNGTNVVFEIAINSAVYPPVATGNDANGDALEQNGIVIGVSKIFGFDVNTGVKPVVDVTNLSWVVSGIVFYANTTAGAKIRFIENGQDIGAPDKFAIVDDDQYRIIFSPDGISGDGHPVYQYQRAGQQWQNFDLSGADQTLSWSNWSGLDLRPFVACDVPDSGSNAPIITNRLTVEGKNKLQPITITSGNNNLRIAEHSFLTSVLKRTEAGNGANNAKHTEGTGMITQPLDGGSFSSLHFKLPTTTKADFYVSVLDEDKRRANQTAEGNDATDMGIADPCWGNTANSTGGALSAGTDGNSFSPQLCSFRFKSWDDDNDLVAPKNKIYYRHNQNGHNVEADNGILEDQWIDTTATFDWENSPDALFIVNVVGSGNVVELIVSPKGDRSDDEPLASLHLPRVKKDGIKTFGTFATTTPFSGSPMCRVTGRTSGANSGIITITVDGSNNLTGVSTILLSGHGYTAGETCDFQPISNLGVADAGAGTAVITGLVDYDHTSGMGTAFHQTKTHNGYCYHMCFGNNDIGADNVNTVEEIALYTFADSGKTYNVKINPRYETSFGDMLGFKKSSYILSSNDDKITSDNTPNPNQQSQLNPTVLLNIDNLPIKSYVGKRLKKSALLNDKPVGSQQGLTRMIAKLPRFHDDQGDGGSAGTGPYFYNYFDYVIPLHNATQLVVNELDITFRNPDGTLATDIIKSHILFKINNVASAGDGTGRIAKPKAPSSRYDKLDITKGQLQPSISGGFAQDKESKLPTKAEDPWNHGSLGPNKSHAL